MIKRYHEIEDTGELDYNSPRSLQLLLLSVNNGRPPRFCGVDGSLGSRCKATLYIAVLHFYFHVPCSMLLHTRHCRFASQG